MRLLVCGSRTWEERERTQREIAALVPDVLIHGDAGQYNWRFDGTGMSSDILFAWLARQWASNYGHALQVVAFPADWTRGPVGGPERNARMLAEGKPDRGLAFGALWREEKARQFTQSGTIANYHKWKRTGTGDMVKRMLRAGVPVRWIAAPDASAVDLTTMPEPPK